MSINKSIPSNHIKLIEKHLSLSSRPVIFELTSSIEDWENQGCPHVIELVEQYDNAYCYIDSGYGFMLLIVEDKIRGDKIARGREVCSIGNIVALNKNYFGLESYIFKGNLKNE